MGKHLSNLIALACKLFFLGGDGSDVHDHRVGRLGEYVAATRLYLSGYRGVRMNYRVGGGEIDILAFHGHKLCVVEVKSGFGNPLPPRRRVGYRKRQRLRRLARRLPRRRLFRNRVIRFDIVEVDFGEGLLDVPAVTLLTNVDNKGGR